MISSLCSEYDKDLVHFKYSVTSDQLDHDSPATTTTTTTTTTTLHIVPIMYNYANTIDISS
jgi:hypothetical protein